MKNTQFTKNGAKRIAREKRVRGRVLSRWDRATDKAWKKKHARTLRP